MKKIAHVVFDHDGTLVDTSRTGELYSGILEMLEQLNQNGVKLYVWTARSRYSTVEFLKSLGIISRFEQLRCSTDADPKPCASGLADMLGNPDPTSVIVVGDSFTDIAGAKSFGALSIGALWDSQDGQDRRRHRETLQECGANFLADSVEECRLKILELTK